MSRANMYKRWQHMMDRCYNPDHPKYKDYGGRGIEVCQRWHTPNLFIADIGEAPEGMTFDRIDNDGGYYPDNVRWATHAEQNMNRRRVGRLPGGVNTKPNPNQWYRIFDGEVEITFREAAERAGRTKKGLISRMRKIENKTNRHHFQVKELSKNI